jgi:hypothetical protein
MAMKVFATTLRLLCDYRIAKNDGDEGVCYTYLLGVSRRNQGRWWCVCPTASERHILSPVVSEMFVTLANHHSMTAIAIATHCYHAVDVSVCVCFLRLRLRFESLGSRGRS